MLWARLLKYAILAAAFAAVAYVAWKMIDDKTTCKLSNFHVPQLNKGENICDETTWKDLAAANQGMFEACKEDTSAKKCCYIYGADTSDCVKECLTPYNRKYGKDAIETYDGDDKKSCKDKNICICSTKP